MADKHMQLPWEDLRRMEGDFPWPSLETFADAVAADPDLARELFAEYERAWQAVDVPTYLDLYVPAIFALAAPKLGEEQRREIGSFLVDKLIEAGNATKPGSISFSTKVRPASLTSARPLKPRSSSVCPWDRPPDRHAWPSPPPT
jgi:hypothetical protein